MPWHWEIAGKDGGLLLQGWRLGSHSSLMQFGLNQEPCPAGWPATGQDWMEECRQQHIKIDSKECADLSPWKAADYQEDVQRQGQLAFSIAKMYLQAA